MKMSNNCPSCSLKLSEKLLNFNESLPVKIPKMTRPENEPIKLLTCDHCQIYIWSEIHLNVFRITIMLDGEKSCSWTMPYRGELCIFAPNLSEERGCSIIYLNIPSTKYLDLSNLILLKNKIKTYITFC